MLAMRDPDLTDPDNPEWTAADFAESVRVGDHPSLEAAMDAAQAKYHAARRGRGPQKAPRKQMVSLRLDAAVLERFRATGKGWQSRINTTLAAHAPRARRPTRATTAKPRRAHR
jgi:uncharacterized protein (DUF4415 family)